MKLGELQMRLIRSSFDEIVADIKRKLDEASLARSRLGTLPSQLLEKRHLFHSVKDDFTNTIEPLVMGGRMQKNVKRSNNHLLNSSVASEKLKSKLYASRLANISDVHVGDDVIAFVDDKETKGKVCYIEGDNIFLPGVFQNATSYGNPGGKTVGDVHCSKDGKTAYTKIGDGNFRLLKPIPRKMVHRDPEWIKLKIVENRPYKLPIFINTEIFEKIVADLIYDEWNEPCLELLEYTATLMETTSKNYIEDNIEAIESLPNLRNFLKRTSTEVVEELKEESRKKIVDFVDRETIPYTQNHYLYENISKLRSKKLQDEMIAMIGNDQGLIDKSAVIKIVQNVFERNQGRSMDDHMAEEMQNALNAYGKVALKRFIDNIPMICIEVMQQFSRNINNVLSNVLDEEIDRHCCCSS